MIGKRFEFPVIMGIDRKAGGIVVWVCLVVGEDLKHGQRFKISWQAKKLGKGMLEGHRWVATTSSETMLTFGCGQEDDIGVV